MLDESTPIKPSWSRTWPVVLALWAASLVTGKKEEIMEEETSEAEGYKVETEAGESKTRRRRGGKK